MPFTIKVILFSGGTGSFGRKFTEIVLKGHRLKLSAIFTF